MDMSLVASSLGGKAGAAQMQIAQTLIKTNADAERSAVMTLLGDAIQNSNPLANVGAGIGTKVDKTA
jgi:fatty acid/phospholipid biosynthesis enzyme